MCKFAMARRELKLCPPMNPMQIHLNPRNVRITSSLRDFVAEKLARLGGMVSDIVQAHVVFKRTDTAAKESHFSVNVRLAVPGKDVFASDSDGSLYAAIDKVSAKLARRLRKRKTRLLDKSESRARAAARSGDELALAQAFQAEVRE